MSKGHTPGPWRLEHHAGFRAPDETDFSVVAPNFICPGIIWGGIPESDANAKLIAAAPALSDALARMLADVEAWQANPGGHSPTSAVADARAALTLAGRRPS